MKRTLLLLVVIAFAVTGQQPFRLSKTPVEQFLCSMDFSFAVENDGIAVASVTAFNTQTGANSTSEIIAASPAPFVIPGTDKIAFMVQGGQANDLHHISVQATDTTTGAQFVGQVDLRVSPWP